MPNRENHELLIQYIRQNTIDFLNLWSIFYEYSQSNFYGFSSSSNSQLGNLTLFYVCFSLHSEITTASVASPHLWNYLHDSYADFNLAQIFAIYQKFSGRDIGYLFYGASLGLFCTYVLFSFKIKSSLHLLSMGTTIGFFLLLMNIYGLPLLLLVIILIVLSGLIASSRLHLNAHSPNELAVGFLLGLLSQTIIFLAL